MLSRVRVLRPQGTRLRKGAIVTRGALEAANVEHARPGGCGCGAGADAALGAWALKGIARHRRRVCNGRMPSIGMGETIMMIPILLLIVAAFHVWGEGR